MAFAWGVPLDGWLPVGHRLALFQATNYVSARPISNRLRAAPSRCTCRMPIACSTSVTCVTNSARAGGAWCRWSDRYDEVGPGDAGDTRHLTAPSSISGTDGAGINAVLAAVARF